MKTVYVITWQYNTGAGFDWYAQKTDADKAWRRELNNVRQLANENWTAFRFEHVTKQRTAETITDEIDNDLDHLCESATKTIGAGFKAVNKFVESN